MTPNIEIPNYPKLKREEIPIKHLDPVARSLAKPDACAKPATLGSKVRVRITTTASPKPRKRKRDPRDVNFY